MIDWGSGIIVVFLVLLLSAQRNSRVAVRVGAGLVFANPGRWAGIVSSRYICIGDIAKTMTSLCTLLSVLAGVLYFIQGPELL